MKSIERLRVELLQNPLSGNRMSMVITIALFFLWFWFYRPVFSYLRIIFTRQEFRTNQIVLFGVLILLFLQLRKGSYTLHLDARPRLYLPALLFALGGSSVFLLVERFLDINTLSASLFGLASYGLIGLWMAPRRWRQGLPAALLLIGALPFGEHMQTFIGYPVRLFTASIVRDGLAVLGVQSIGVDTILVFENGISQVDLPCSGVQSLWTGGLFLFAATWVDRRKLGLRWMGVATVFILLLLAANLVRVGVLVAVGEVAGLRLTAEMLHVPLGVLGFAGACAAAVYLLRWVGSHVPMENEEPGERNANQVALPRPSWLVPLMMGIILVFALLYTPRPQESIAQAGAGWIFPSELNMDPWPLTPKELEWLGSGSAISGERWRFNWRGHTGSILFVTSTSWRAHHRPERCFEVYGLSVEDARTYLVASDFSLRSLSLDARGESQLYSAVYWLQSPGKATDDYATRIWADLKPDRDTWVLVTILFDEAANPLSTDFLPLYPALRHAVARNLEGDYQP